MGIVVLKIDVIAALYNLRFGLVYSTILLLSNILLKLCQMWYIRLCVYYLVRVVFAVYTTWYIKFS